MRIKLSILNLTNRFYVAMGLFSNRSQMTSKCGKNKFISEQVHDNMESLCFYNKETKK